MVLAIQHTTQIAYAFLHHPLIDLSIPNGTVLTPSIRISQYRTYPIPTVNSSIINGLITVRFGVYLIIYVTVLLATFRIPKINCHGPPKKFTWPMSR